MQRHLVLLFAAIALASCSTVHVTRVYNASTAKHDHGALPSQQFVDQVGIPALETTQPFLVSKPMVVTKLRVALWFVFRGPWDLLTSEQLWQTKGRLLVSNGTHRYVPILDLSLNVSKDGQGQDLPIQIAGRGEALQLQFEHNDTNITLYPQNVYYIYPQVPIPRNYDPIHGTETRVYWSQAQDDGESYDPIFLSTPLVRDTEDLLAADATTWRVPTDELANVFGGAEMSKAPFLALDIHLECVEEVTVVPSQTPATSEQNGPSTPSQKLTGATHLSPAQTGAVVAIVATGTISVLLLAIALSIWKRIRDGDAQTNFTRVFDSIARCTGYDPSGFAALDPPEVRVVKERNQLIGTLEAHRYQTVSVIHRDNVGIILDSDSDSLANSSGSDL